MVDRSRPELPRVLYRVVYEAAVGWPHPERRERKQRTYPSAEAAGRQVAAIEALPSHLALVGVYVTDPITWNEIDAGAIRAEEVSDECLNLGTE